MLSIDMFTESTSTSANSECKLLEHVQQQHQLNDLGASPPVARPVPSRQARSTTAPSASSALLSSTVCLLFLVLVCSSTLCCGRLVGHRHHFLLEEEEDYPHKDVQQQQQETVPLLEGKLLIKPSAQRKASVADEHVCAKSTDRNATLVQSLSKSTGQPVLLLHSAQNTFGVTYCAKNSGGVEEEGIDDTEGEDASKQCAMGSNCATIYRWTKALIHPAERTINNIMQFDPATLEDDVLIPVDCLCVLNWATTFRGQGPIILE